MFNPPAADAGTTDPILNALKNKNNLRNSSPINFSQTGQFGGLNNLNSGNQNLAFMQNPVMNLLNSQGNLNQMSTLTSSQQVPFMPAPTPRLNSYNFKERELQNTPSVQPPMPNVNIILIFVG